MNEKADLSCIDLGLPLQDLTIHSIKTNSKYTKLPIKSERELRPPHSISILSRIFFTWSLKSMSIANKTSLKPQHIINDYYINSTRSELSFLKSIWLGGYNKSRYCPLLLAIIRANLTSLAILFIVTFFATALKFIQIYLLRQLLLVFQWLQDPSLEKPLFSLHFSVICFLLIKVIYILTQYQIKYLENMIGRKTANQISSIVYEKTMKTFSISKQKFSEGEMFTYIQVDVETLGLFFYYCPKTIVIPFQFAMYFYLLFNFFGASFISSFITFVILMAISYILQLLYLNYQKIYLRDKDSRMKMTSEVFHMLKTLKLFSWDDDFKDKITNKREIEMKSMKTILTLEVLTGFIHWGIPLLLSIVSVGGYTYVKGVMDIANLLTSIDIFDSMTGPLYRLPTFITSLLNALVSMERIGKFLNENENVVYSYSDLNYKDKAIKISKCNFSVPMQVNVLSSHKILLNDINLEINQGEFIAVLGETGSGKSCFINALLSGLDMIPKDEEYQFIINGALSYASQKPWIMNETIKQNILFFNDLDQKKYETILKICQLDKDLLELPAGDITEVGANGTNLSGGQKARISLARSVYANADIYLFDDPISSCDSFVSSRIFQDVFDKHLIGKTRIVVTNDIRNLHLVNRIVFFDKGNIKWIGTYDQLIHQQFYIDITTNQQRTHSIDYTSPLIDDLHNTTISNEGLEPNIETNCRNSNIKDNLFTVSELEKKARLIKEEDQAKGRIGCSLYNRFFHSIGGYWFLSILISVSIGWQVSKVCSNVYLAQWTIDKSNTNNLYSFVIYSIIGLISILCLFLKDFIISRGILNINKQLHDSMLIRLIKAPINLFHDTIPIGQIINRLTNDLEQCKPIIKACSSFLKSNCTLIGAIIVCCQYNKYCLILSPLLLLSGLGIAYYYINAGRDLHRLDGISRSPIISLYSETVMGMDTIKAFNSEDYFKDLFFDYLDDYYSIVNFKFGAETWFNLHLELLSVIYIFFILLFALIFKSSFTAQSIGLLIKYSISFSEELLGVLDYLVDIETALVSIERCNAFTNIVQEKESIVPEKDNELINWPNEGKIEFKQYSTRYRPEIDLVLKDISFTINQKEKIGVVGRTGSGKSTLALSLFRLLERESGSILIDDIDIASIGLKKLREALTIVPQDPTLFEGTIKDNLDPLNKSTPNEIDEAINKVNLFKLMNENGRDTSLGVNMLIKDNGKNLSMGEQQLICFARTLLRKSKIILLDEATANVDQKTEEIIQKTIDDIFIDSTTITIAHRLQTVLKCDRVLVMDKGRVVEYDTPTNLLNKSNGVFKMLYNNNNH